MPPNVPLRSLARFFICFMEGKGEMILGDYNLLLLLLSTAEERKENSNCDFLRGSITAGLIRDYFCVGSSFGAGSPYTLLAYLLETSSGSDATIEFYTYISIFDLSSVLNGREPLLPLPRSKLLPIGRDSFKPTDWSILTDFAGSTGPVFCCLKMD